MKYLSRRPDADDSCNIASDMYVDESGQRAHLELFTIVVVASTRTISAAAAVHSARTVADACGQGKRWCNC
jgi:hypothetical protein